MTQSPQTSTVEPPASTRPWPAVIGAVSILFALARLGVVAERLYKMTFRERGVWTLGTLWPQVLAVLLSALLIAAGVKLARRLRAGAVLHLVWAAPALILSVAMLGIFLYNIDSYYLLPPRGRFFTIALTLLVNISTILYGLFLLVWFLRDDVWAQIRKW
jgi:hypothetical protein